MAEQAGAKALDERLRADLRKAGDFSRVHALRRSGVDAPMISTQAPITWQAIRLSAADALAGRGRA